MDACGLEIESRNTSLKASLDKGRNMIMASYPLKDAEHHIRKFDEWVEKMREGGVFGELEGPPPNTSQRGFYLDTLKNRLSQAREKMAGAGVFGRDKHQKEETKLLDLIRQTQFNFSNYFSDKDPEQEQVEQNGAQGGEQALDTSEDACYGVA